MPGTKTLYRLGLQMLLISILLGITLPCNAQITVGIKMGLQVPGAQDLKFKQFDESLQLIRTVHTNRVVRELSPLYGIMISYTGKQGFWQKTQIRIETATWEFYSRSRGFFVEKPPPIISAEQCRTAILISVLRKLAGPSFMESMNIQGSYWYLGAGGGVVSTDIDPGRFELNMGLNLIAGLAVPIGKKFEGLFEIKYLVTHDADNNIVDSKGWYVDTSGTESWLRIGPHLDTRFITVQVGIQWVVSW